MIKLMFFAIMGGSSSNFTQLDPERSNLSYTGVIRRSESFKVIDTDTNLKPVCNAR